MGKSLQSGTPLRLRDVTAVYSAKKKYARDMEFYAFLQFEFFRQWYKLKKYANDNGIQIIGDIPIYCALDSADVWCEPQLFQLDRDRVPTVVAGFPPGRILGGRAVVGKPHLRLGQNEAGKLSLVGRQNELRKEAV